MKEIKAIIQPFMLTKVLEGLRSIDGLPAVTVSEVRALGVERGHYEQIVKSKLEIVVADEMVSLVVDTVQANAHTGKAGDGRVFVIPVEESIKIRSGARDADQGVKL